MVVFRGFVLAILLCAVAAQPKDFIGLLAADLDDTPIAFLTEPESEALVVDSETSAYSHIKVGVPGRRRRDASHTAASSTQGECAPPLVPMGSASAASVEEESMVLAGAKPAYKRPPNKEYNPPELHNIAPTEDNGLDVNGVDNDNLRKAAVIAATKHKCQDLALGRCIGSMPNSELRPIA